MAAAGQAGEEKLLSAYRHFSWRDRLSRSEKKNFSGISPFLLAGHAYVGSPAFGAGEIGVSPAFGAGRIGIFLSPITFPLQIGKSNLISQ